MSSVSYPVSNITAGVSTQEYSLRMDGQASDQSNAFNSPRYGLCKRPNSNYLATVETAFPMSSPLMFPMVYGGSESMFIHGSPVPALFNCKSGARTPITVFPSSAVTEDGEENLTPSYTQYGMLSAGAGYPSTLKYMRIGDVTFIANTSIQPAMQATTWEGYTNSSSVIPKGAIGSDHHNHGDDSFLSVGGIKNDDVWAAWIQQIDPNVVTTYRISWSEEMPAYTEADGTEHEALITEYNTGVDRKKLKGGATQAATFHSCPSGGHDNNQAEDDPASEYQYYWALNYPSAPNAMHLACKLAWRATEKQNAHGDYMMQATSLSTVGYAAGASNQLTAMQKGVTSIMGRYINQEGAVYDDGSGAPEPARNGKLIAVSGVGSVSNAHSLNKVGRGVELTDHFALAWKTVDNITELPPLSWVDHTLKVASDETNPFGFYMRFVSDAVKPQTYSHVGPAATDGNYPVFTESSSLTKVGHWEEHCGVGVSTDVDSSTMPHMVVRRPDGSFAFMEARGSFQINTQNSALGMGDPPRIHFRPDSGFGDFASLSDGFTPLVVGDTITFSELPDSDALPVEFSYETEYYVSVVEPPSELLSGVVIELSATKGGPSINYTEHLFNNIQGVNIATYEDLVYDPRRAGDDDTNALPDFFTNPIEGLFSYQDRLGIYTENEVTLSATGDAFNFFRSTVRDLLDSDRLKVRPSQADNESIQQIIPYKTGLVIVTNRKQLLLYGADGSLSPRTVTVVEASAAETDIHTTPIAVNDSLYLAYTTTNGGGMYELYPQSEQNFAIRDVSVQIPGYLPEGPRALQASSKHNTLFWLDDGTGVNATARDQETLYVYTWDVTGPQKQQSAWTKWEFNANNAHDTLVGYKIHNIVCLGDRLYMLTESDGCVVLEYIDLDITRPETDLDDTTEAAFDGILLDRLIPRASITSIIDSGDDTIIQIPYEIPTTSDVNLDDDVVIVATSGSTTTYYTTGITVSPQADLGTGGTSTPGMTMITLENANLKGTGTGGETVEGEPDPWSINVWVGFKYTMSHTLGSFSPVIGDRAVRGRNVFVRGGRLTYSKLNTLKIATDDTRTQTISAGGTASKSGEEFFAIHQHINDLNVTITNDTPWQAMIQGLDYELNVQEGVQKTRWSR